MISVEEAFELIEQRVSALPPLLSETIRLEAAVDRVLAQPIVSDVDSPCLLYTSPSPRDRQKSRMPSSA